MQESRQLLGDSIEKDTPVTVTAKSEHIHPPVPSSGETPQQLAAQAMAFHARAEISEMEALVNVWEAGVRLNLAFNTIRFGGWGSFLQENCPQLSRTTLWRYRKIATCFTLEQLDGLTLSDAYAKLDLAKFEEEALTIEAEERQVSSGNGSVKKPTAFQQVAKLAKKFQAPETLSEMEQEVVRNAALDLEDVHEAILGEPSILSVRWRVKIDEGVSGWSDDDLQLFNDEFSKLQDVWEQVQGVEVVQ